ncbi:uncharacterized protein LOC119662008 [Teleopsis dalmanni]|uniref:uncharacterized protein LOC119662008 n=1 Tax=Teleopsis dalmanni TaxID=139649 RepID=UPI0018CEAF03|nr:uncharacterized protein LOC119662008 [Teleopsis dalmanni]
MEKDYLKFRRLAGCNELSHPPLYSPNGDALFTLSHNLVQVFSSTTGQLLRQLEGANDKLISMEIGLKQNDMLVACSESGELLRWEWQSGDLMKRLEIKLPNIKVLTCNQLNFYGNADTASLFITYKSDTTQFVQWMLIDTNKGNQRRVRCSLVLKKQTPLVSVDTENHNYIALVQGFYVYFIDYKTWQWSRLKNAHEVPVTVVRVHPKEHMIATGDNLGKIFLWREFMNQQTVKTSLYHWHHTSVTSIAFSASGTSFYSSGLESVLVKWNIAKPDIRQFIPRIGAYIRHIVVCSNNSQVAVCTADNAVRIMGADEKLICTLHDFTYIPDDKTGKDRFPVGLRLNPRSNTLALNGRIGHLQFYSVYTKSLLYNLDVVMQNQLSTEANKILYNISVEQAAFNIDWMVTGEVFNDNEHFPELRLKFWRFKDEIQNYSLNTVIELAHDVGLSAIEFSSDYSVDNLLCATAGKDHKVKLWALGTSDDIHKTDKYWYNLAQFSYKDLPIASLSFSQDGSLLAAGFGDTLCIYNMATLKLKVALSGTVGADGAIHKAQIVVPKVKTTFDDEMYEKRAKVMQFFVNLLEDNEKSALNNLQELLNTSDTSSTVQQQPVTSLSAVSQEDKKELFREILDIQELNFYQKVLLFQKLGITCKPREGMETRLASYLRKTVCNEFINVKIKDLHKKVAQLSRRERFRAKYRLHLYTRRKRNYDEEIAQNLVPILSVLNIQDITKSSKESKNTSRQEDITQQQKERKEAYDRTTHRILPIPQVPAVIKKVQFATNQFAHMILACTENRVLIWNLLTLRIESVMNLSMKHFSFDPLNSLVAVINIHNELFVFQPHVTWPLYHRASMPEMHGTVWLPRRYVIPSSLNINWQSQSILFFLTEKQEIIYLSADEDLDAGAPKPVIFEKTSTPLGVQYTTFGTYATKQIINKKPVRQRIGPLVQSNAGKEAIKAFVSMSTHTMPPMHLLAADLLQAMLSRFSETPVQSKERKIAAQLRNGGQRGGDENGDDDGDDDDDDVDNNDAMIGSRRINGGIVGTQNGLVEVDDTVNLTSAKTVNQGESKALALRKHLLLRNEEISKEKNILKLKSMDEISLNKELLHIAEQEIEF